MGVHFLSRGSWPVGGPAKHTVPSRASQGPEGLCLCGIYSKPVFPVCLSVCLLVVDMSEVPGSSEV